MKNILKGFVVFSLSLIIFSSSLLSLNAKSDEEYKKIAPQELSTYLEGQELIVDFKYNDGIFKIFTYSEDKDIIVYDDDMDRAYLIDKTEGNMLTFPSFGEKLRLFTREGMDTKTGRGYGFMDASGKVVVEPTYELGDLMFSSVASMGMYRGIGGIDHVLINDKGELITDKTYSFISRFMMPKSYLDVDSQYTFKAYDSKYFKDFIPVDYAYFMHDTNAEYKQVISFSNKDKKYLKNWELRAGKKGLIGKDGKEILPDVYRDILVGDSYLIAVSKEIRKYGYVNTEGEVVLPMKYDLATRFKDGKAAIVKDGQIAFIDENLNLLQDFKKADNWKSLYQVGDVDALNVAYYNKAKHPASNWAREYVLLADSLGIVSDELKTKYKKKINRQEFSELIIASIFLNATNPDLENSASQLKILDNAVNEGEEMPFKDTDSRFVGLAYRLGIVNGRSADVFDPKGAISRQEAAAMLIRAYRIFQDERVLEYWEGEMDKDLEEVFRDSNLVANWAKKDVNFVKTLGLMNGVGDRKFDPRGTYTVEQSITTIIRLYEGL